MLAGFAIGAPLMWTAGFAVGGLVDGCGRLAVGLLMTSARVGAVQDPRFRERRDGPERAALPRIQVDGLCQARPADRAAGPVRRPDVRPFDRSPVRPRHGMKRLERPAVRLPLPDAAAPPPVPVRPARFRPRTPARPPDEPRRPDRPAVLDPVRDRVGRPNIRPVRLPIERPPVSDRPFAPALRPDDRRLETARATAPTAAAPASHTHRPPSAVRIIAITFPPANATSLAGTFASAC